MIIACHYRRESFLSALASPPPQPEINFFGTDEIVDEGPATDLPTEAAQAASETPRKPKEKRERKPRPEKKTVESVTPSADAGSAPIAEKTPRKNDKFRSEKPKKAVPTVSPNEKDNNAAAANEKAPKGPRPPKVNAGPKKEVAPVAEMSAGPPAKPVSWSAAVSPAAAPVADAPTKPAVKYAASRGPKPTGDVNRVPRPGNKPAGERKTVAKN